MSNKCLLCGSETTQIFNIKLKAKHVCEVCERLIVKQSVIDVYNKKWVKE